MRRYVLVVLLTLLTATGVPAKGKWQKASGSGCLLWNADPQPNETVSWSGACRDDKAEGEGLATWSFRKGPRKQVVRYKGEMLAGHLHGRGTLYGESGYRAEGEWYKGKFHGKGMLLSASGSRYEGEWLNGQRHGRGTFTAANGDHYEGRWRKDKKHGRGAYYFAAGDRYTGPFLNDNLHGIGVCFDKNEGNRGCEWSHGEFIRWVD